MLTLINCNRMLPPIAPIGTDYIAGAVHQAGIDVELLDLNLAEDTTATLTEYFQRRQPELVGLSFRNVDDCFWPSGRSFLPTVRQDVADLRQQTDAPIVLGGVGYSIFPQAILRHVGADFGIRGDGEQALIALLRELRGQREWERVPGLVWTDGDKIRTNAPSWPRDLNVPTERGFVDNRTYFRRGGQIGLETKRGCPRQCIYCADPLAKGSSHRLRDPARVADEVQSLLDRSVDVLHMCDAEFNLPPRHAEQVCDEFIRRGFGKRVRWYAYLAVVPFTPKLAERMRQAGCVGINFTSDSTHATMLKTYGQPHRRADLAEAVRLCRQYDMTVMLDLLLGGPGETPETVSQTIKEVKQIDPDCAGAALGIRVYPGTPMAATVQTEGPPAINPNILRHYDGQIDLLQPTFYISQALGPNPARLVRQITGEDARFFLPEMEGESESLQRSGDHNYNENQALIDAIGAGARGAYWDILRQLRHT